MLTIKRYPTLKILYLLSVSGEIKREKLRERARPRGGKRERGRVQDLVVPTARRIGG
jgi:hypothetical protein